MRQLAWPTSQIRCCVVRWSGDVKHRLLPIICSTKSQVSNNITNPSPLHASTRFHQPTPLTAFNCEAIRLPQWRTMTLNSLMTRSNEVKIVVNIQFTKSRRQQIPLSIPDSSPRKPYIGLCFGPQLFASSNIHIPCLSIAIAILTSYTAIRPLVRRLRNYTIISLDQHP